MSETDRRAASILPRRRMLHREGGRRVEDRAADDLRDADAELAASAHVLARAEWVSIKHYAELNDIHRNTVTKWIAAGLLSVYRAKRIVRVKNVPPKQSADACPPTHIGENA